MLARIEPMREKVYMNRLTGEIYLWTNKRYAHSKRLKYWFYITAENDYFTECSDELELLGEL